MKILCKNSCVFENKHFLFFHFLFSLNNYLQPVCFGRVVLERELKGTAVVRVGEGSLLQAAEGVHGGKSGEGGSALDLEYLEG